jgi:hypothetical protein
LIRSGATPVSDRGGKIVNVLGGFSSSPPTRSAAGGPFVLHKVRSYHKH